MFDILKVKGTLRLVKYDKNGRIVDDTRINNLIVDKGLEMAAKLLNGISTNPFNYIAIGNGTTSPAASDTELESEIMRVEASPSYEPFKSIFSCLIQFSSSTSISEAGIFDASSGGNMLSRVTFATKNFDAGESLGVYWSIEHNRS